MIKNIVYHVLVKEQGSTDNVSVSEFFKVVVTIKPN